jgi:hypothetical protein
VNVLIEMPAWQLTLAKVFVGFAAGEINVLI